MCSLGMIVIRRIWQNLDLSRELAIFAKRRIAKLRPPATPIINIDPHFSVWTEEAVLQNIVHWTGKSNTMKGRVLTETSIISLD